MKFVTATKKKLKAKISLQGPPGAGKSYSALKIAKTLAGGDMSKVAFLDTEERSASLYSNEFPFVEPDPRITEPFHPDKVVAFLDGAAKAGMEVAIIDSLTHFWNGPGGMLELVDEEVKAQRAKGWKADSHAAWKEVDKVYKRLVRALISAPIHTIVCLRAKVETVKDTDEKGKQIVKRLGMAAEIRDSFAFEMSIEGMLNSEHSLVIGKTRCPLVDGKVFHRPGEEFANLVLTWLNDGASEEEAASQAPTSDPSPTAAKPASALDGWLAKVATLTAKEDLRKAYVEAGNAPELNAQERATVLTEVRKRGEAIKGAA